MTRIWAHRVSIVGLLRPCLLSAKVSVGFLAIPTLARSAACAFAEALGWRQGLDKKIKQASMRVVLTDLWENRHRVSSQAAEKSP